MIYQSWFELDGHTFGITTDDRDYYEAYLDRMEQARANPVAEPWFRKRAVLKAVFEGQKAKRRGGKK